MNEKICPLLAAVPLGEKPDCKGDRCAWWSEERKRCAFALLADSLDDINVHGITVYGG